MWIKFNGNPAGRNVGDCAVRAISVALSVDWETAYAMLVGSAFAMADMPSSDAVSGAVLRRHGFKRKNIPRSWTTCKDRGRGFGYPEASAHNGPIGLLSRG